MRLSRHRRRALAVILLSLSAACGIDTAGTGAPGASDAIERGADGSAPNEGGPPASDGEAGFHDDDAGDDGGSADGGIITDAALDADAAGPTCIAAAPSMVGWWAADSNMNDRVASHTGVSGTQGGATAVAFAPGKVAGSFNLAGKSYVQIPNAPSLQITAAITIEAWIFATALGGRVLDKITAGAADGYLLDTSASKLRLIVGPTHLSSAANLPTNVWVHVAGTWDGATGRIFVNGAVVGTEAISGAIPKTSLAVRIGGDSSGANRFAGKIDEVALYNRALSTAEIAAVVAAGPHGRCKL